MHLIFFMSAWDLNSVPQVYVADPLQTKPPPQPACLSPSFPLSLPSSDGLYYVAQSDLQLAIFLLQPPEHRDHRLVP